MSRVPVFFGQHTLYGPFCVAAVASALFSGRYVRAVILALPIYCIDASFTYLSLGVVVGLFLIHKFGRTALLGLIIAGVLGGLVVCKELLFRDNVRVEALNDNGRFALWKLTWRIAEARPFIGHGYGSFRNQFPAFQDKRIREMNGLKDESFSPEVQEVLAKAAELQKRSGLFVSAHNEYLETFYEFGFIGPLFCLALIAAFLLAWACGPRESIDWALCAIFLSFCANALGNFPFHLIPQALLPLWAFVAVTSRERWSIVNL